MAEASNAEKMERLRKGLPGVYDFHIVIGESYERLDDLMREAKTLALRFHGTADLIGGTYDRPESLRIEIKG